MSSLNKLLFVAALMYSSIPRESDWQIKIDECIGEYWNVIVHLPRKQKKKRKIALQKHYNFLLTMQKWSKNPFGN